MPACFWTGNMEIPMEEEIFDFGSKWWVNCTSGIGRGIPFECKQGHSIVCRNVEYVKVKSTWIRLVEIQV